MNWQRNTKLAQLPRLSEMFRESQLCKCSAKICSFSFQLKNMKTVISESTVDVISIGNAKNKAEIKTGRRKGRLGMIVQKMDVRSCL